MGRREVRELLREAEREQDEDALDAPFGGSEPEQAS
jgi:hypothetical protein